MIKKKPVKTEFVIVWEFRVRSRKRREFKRTYGPNGVWVKFFRSGKGYIRTQLVRDLKTAGRYLTLDFWTSREAYLRFKKENRAEYQAIDEKCLSLTENEVKVGEFRRLAGPKATAVASLNGLGSSRDRFPSAYALGYSNAVAFATGASAHPNFASLAEL